MTTWQVIKAAQAVQEQALAIIDYVARCTTLPEAVALRRIAEMQQWLNAQVDAELLGMNVLDYITSVDCMDERHEKDPA